MPGPGVGGVRARLARDLIGGAGAEQAL
jgi:hypothetical protein